MSELKVNYQTNPSQYKHLSLTTEGNVARLTIDIDEDSGIRPGYKLKLNSYDLGVDIELHDALNRLRFEHPEVRSVVVSSGKERIFCSGANIFMLGLSSHAWKVNFCKFTNETRNSIEDTSEHSGVKFIAAVNGAVLVAVTSWPWPVMKSIWWMIAPRRCRCLKFLCSGFCRGPAG